MQAQSFKIANTSPTNICQMNTFFIIYTLKNLKPWFNNRSEDCHEIKCSDNIASALIKKWNLQVAHSLIKSLLHFTLGLREAKLANSFELLPAQPKSKQYIAQILFIFFRFSLHWIALRAFKMMTSISKIKILISSFHLDQ